jgi:hypothetical protein
LRPISILSMQLTRRTFGTKVSVSALVRNQTSVVVNQTSVGLTSDQVSSRQLLEGFQNSLKGPSNLPKLLKYFSRLKFSENPKFVRFTCRCSARFRLLRRFFMNLHRLDGWFRIRLLCKLWCRISACFQVVRPKIIGSQIRKYFDPHLQKRVGRKSI